MTKESTGNSDDCLNRARRLARQQLLSLQLSGLDFLPIAKQIHKFEFANAVETELNHDVVCEPPATEITDDSQPASPSASSDTTGLFEAGEHRYHSAPRDIEARVSELAIVESEVAKCTLCSELAACRQNTVFGSGNPMPDLCFVGEGPGADEDRQGEPFVGAAGQLLNKIIQACGMSRDQVYILNTVKCRPPGNRNPDEVELGNCWPYAERQLEILQPEFICCLGSVAARTLLHSKQSIGRMRGQFFRYRGSRVVVTYHPAYLLRNPAAKRQVWDDMKMLMAAMGRQV